MTESPDLPDLPIGPSAHYLHYKLLDIQELISTIHHNLTQIQNESKDLAAITRYLASIDICKINPNYDPIRRFLEAERQTHNSPIIFDCPILDRDKYQIYTITLDDFPLTEEATRNPELAEDPNREAQQSTSAVNTIPESESETRPARFRRPKRRYDIDDPKRDLILDLQRLNTTLKQLRRQASSIISRIESNPQEFQNLAKQTKKKIHLLLDTGEIDINEVRTNLSLK
jgi:hypothetical protein